MVLYLLRRMVYAIPIALAVGFVCFMLVQIAPGDPINAIVPPDAPAAADGARAGGPSATHAQACGILPAPGAGAPARTGGPPRRTPASLAQA